MKKIIWSNYPKDIFYKGYEKNYKESLSERLGILGIDEKDITDEMINNEVYEDNNYSLEFERDNLDIQLSGEILVIASLGLWSGTAYGYKFIKSGNIKDILYSDCDYGEWYSDGFNIKSRQSHHDGTNLYEYREVRQGVNIGNFLKDIYNNKKTLRSRLNYYTKSILPEVAKVYGW